MASPLNLNLVATRKKNWRLDGLNLDRQRDWLDVSKQDSTLIPGAAETRSCVQSSLLPPPGSEANVARGRGAAAREGSGPGLC
jgi:hypothetical protein